MRRGEGEREGEERPLGQWWDCSNSSSSSSSTSSSTSSSSGNFGCGYDGGG